MEAKYWNAKDTGMGHILLLNVLFIEKYRSGLTSSVYEPKNTLIHYPTFTQKKEKKRIGMFH